MLLVFSIGNQQRMDYIFVFVDPMFGAKGAQPGMCCDTPIIWLMVEYESKNASIGICSTRPGSGDRINGSFGEKVCLLREKDPVSHTKRCDFTMEASITITAVLLTIAVQLPLLGSKDAFILSTAAT